MAVSEDELEAIQISIYIVLKETLKENDDAKDCAHPHQRDFGIL